jgi:hypothetical protein
MHVQPPRAVVWRSARRLGPVQHLGDHEVVVFTEHRRRGVVRDKSEVIGREALAAAWQVDPNK